MKRAVQTGMLLQRGCGLTLLTPDEVRETHYAGLEILAKTGVFVDSEEALEIFHSIGCVVDKSIKRVRIPAHLVEAALNSAPSQFIVRGRDPQRALRIGGKRVSFTPFGEGVRVNDPYTGEQRDSTKKDLAAITRLSDWIEEFDIIHRAVASQDVHPESYPLHNFEAMIHNTTKPISLGGGNGYLVDKMIQLAAMVRGDKDSLSLEPLMVISTCPVSPLRLVSECCEIAIHGARHRIPVRFTTMALSGSTSPITMVGTMAVQNAEFMACATLSQAVSKGAPIFRSGTSTQLDMKKGDASVGSPEMAMMAAMNAQIAQFHGVPSWTGGT
jgi:trimethylamine--corrinoid protein Co-methyltransferase